MCQLWDEQSKSDIWSTATGVGKHANPQRCTTQNCLHIREVDFVKWKRNMVGLEFRHSQVPSNHMQNILAQNSKQPNATEVNKVGGAHTDANNTQRLTLERPGS